MGVPKRASKRQERADGEMKGVGVGGKPWFLLSLTSTKDPASFIPVPTLIPWQILHCPLGSQVVARRKCWRVPSGPRIDMPSK